MPTRAWILAAAIAVALVSSACAREAPPPAPPAAPPPYKLVASVLEVMEATVAPAAEYIFDAAVWSNGIAINPPKTDDDWEHIWEATVTLAESGNLLMMPGRARDTGDWARWSIALTDAAVVARDAARAKNIDGIVDAGSRIYQACLGCHKKYHPQPAPAAP